MFTVMVMVVDVYIGMMDRDYIGDRALIAEEKLYHVYAIRLMEFVNPIPFSSAVHDHRLLYSARIPPFCPAHIPQLECTYRK